MLFIECLPISYKSHILCIIVFFTPVNQLKSINASCTEKVVPILKSTQTKQMLHHNRKLIFIVAAWRLEVNRRPCGFEKLSVI